ncbi:hypothetical protein ACVNIS_15855 [Sphaerotilaceae bacterium SBD11-9]
MTILTRCSVLSLALLALPAAAQGPVESQRYWFELGAFMPNVNSSARFDNKNTGRPGTSVDFEDDLDLADRRTLPTLLFGTRFGDNWRMEFEYFELKRTGSRSLSRDISFGDADFTVGASINSEFSSKVYRLSGGYSFYKTPDAEIGGVLGLHITDFIVALEGQASVNGGAVALRSERKTQLAPLPTLGLYGSYAFSPAWDISGRADYFTVKIDQYKGRLLNLQGAVRYHFTPTWSLALGYRYDDYRLDGDGEDWTGEVKYRFAGPQLTLRAGF